MALARLDRYAGLFEPLLVYYAMGTKIVCAGLFILRKSFSVISLTISVQVNVAFFADTVRPALSGHSKRRSNFDT